MTRVATAGRVGALLVLAGALIGCAQPPAVRTGQIALELAPAGAPPPRTFDGKPITLSELRARGPVLLVFLRGFT